MKISNKKYIVFFLIGLILLLGFTLRFLEFKSKMHDFNISGDAKNYTIMSQQMVDDHVYGYGLAKKSVKPNAYVTPVYPLFLASVYTVFHDQYLQITIIRLIQVLIGGIISPLLAFLFIRRLMKKDGIALLTALFTAIYPTYILSVNHVLTEVLSLAAMLLYFYLITAALQDKKTWLSILAGAAFSINILIRPTMFPLFFIPFLYAFLTCRHSERKLLIRLFAINLVSMAIVMAPWWIRNFVVLNKFILLATGSEDPLLAGTYPYMQGLFEDYLNEKVRVSEAAYAKKRILEGFTHEPFLYLKWYTIGKLQYIFSEPWLLADYSGKSPVNSAAFYSMKILHGFFVYIGTIGVLVNSIKQRASLYMNVYGIIYLVLLLIFIPVNRYAYHHMFFLMAASAALIYLLLELLNINKLFTKLCKG